MQYSFLGHSHLNHFHGCRWSFKRWKHGSGYVIRTSWNSTERHHSRMRHSLSAHSSGTGTHCTTYEQTPPLIDEKLFVYHASTIVDHNIEIFRFNRCTTRPWVSSISITTLLFTEISKPFVPFYLSHLARQMITSSPFATIRQIF